MLQKRKNVYRGVIVEVINLHILSLERIKWMLIAKKTSHHGNVGSVAIWLVHRIESLFCSLPVRSP